MKRHCICAVILSCLLGILLSACSDDSTSPAQKPKPQVYELLATNGQGITIAVKANQHVEITATDSVNTNPGGPVQDCDLWTDANGIATCHYVWTDANCRGLPFMALIGTCGADSFLVGTDFDSTFAGDCQLTLLVNDWVHSDNDGKFVITVLLK